MVAVVAIGVVLVGVGQPLMGVLVTVPGAGRHGLVMLVLVVLVMDMRMVVSERLVGVSVLMAFGQVKPHPDGHQHRSHSQRPGRGVAEHEREQRSEEWRY